MMLDCLWSGEMAMGTCHRSNACLAFRQRDLAELIAWPLSNYDTWMMVLYLKVQDWLLNDSMIHCICRYFQALDVRNCRLSRAWTWQTMSWGPRIPVALVLQQQMVRLWRRQSEYFIILLMLGVVRVRFPATWKEQNKSNTSISDLLIGTPGAKRL